MKFILSRIPTPKQIFLIDALGALLTTSLLAGGVAQLTQYFGMPSQIVYALAIGAFCLFIYSMSCYLFLKQNHKPFLGVMIVLNTFYMVISAFLLIKHFELLTAFDCCYFIAELLIIVLLVKVEYKIFKRQKA